MTQAPPARAADLPPGTWPWLHRVARWIGTWLFVPFFRVNVTHADRIPATGPVVLVANHSAFVDGPMLFGIVGRRAVFLVKREMFRGILGVLLPLIGQLPVRRRSADRTALMAAVGVLRGGGLVGVFPEGTRGEGDVVAAQQGAAWLARSADALVLPVVCRGTRRGTSGRRWRPRVDIVVGEPFTVPAGGGRTGLAAATETVRAQLAGMVAELDEARSRT